MTDQARSVAVEARLRQLLLSGLDGDGGSYQAFLRELTVHLRAYFRRRLSQFPNEVEDLVQETLLAIHNQRHTYSVGLPLTAWIHAIAKYKLVDMLRRRQSRERITDPLDEDAEVFAAVDNDAAEARQDLTKLLAKLPDRQRLPIIHTKLEGLSVAECAERTGMSESAIKVGVHRGLKALAAMIRGEA